MDDTADTKSTNSSVSSGSAQGVAIITMAKAWFLLVNFAQPLILTRVLDDQYGLYGTAFNFLSILNNVAVQGSIQGMSRSVTEYGPRAIRKGLLLHTSLGIVLAGLLASLAGLIGTHYFRDAQLPQLFRLGAIILGNYTVYAALVGVLNGQRRFVWQARLDMLFSTLRVVLIVALSATALRVAGSLVGFAAATGVILVIALAVVFRHTRQDARAAAEAGATTPEAPLAWGTFLRGYVRFFAPVLVYQLALNMVLQADLLVLKKLLGQALPNAPGEVNSLVGFYKVTQQMAFLPYQLLIAVTFVAFPIVSKTTLLGDREATRRFVSSMMRFSTLALGALLAVFACVPHTVTQILYPPKMWPAGDALRVLVLGQGAFVLAVLGTTIILAAGRTLAATMLMIGMLAAVFLGDYLFIQNTAVGLGSLDATARGTATGCVLGAVAVGVYMVRFLGAYVPAMSLVRVVAALMVCSATAWLGWHGKLVGLIVCGFNVALFLAVILALGEVSRDERARVTAFVRRRLGRAPPPAA